MEKEISQTRKRLQKDIDKIIELINSIEFGSITIIIQDGRIIQLEKNEKMRLK